MNILVTGGAGYIGSVLIGQLIERGHFVRVVDTFQFGTPTSNPPKGLLDAWHVDIREPHPAWFERIDAVAHLAGFSNDPMADCDPALNHEVNVTGTRRIAEAAIAAGVQTFTFGSSASVYDRGSHVTPPFAAEGDDVRAIGAYSTSKADAEAILVGLAKQHRGFRPVIFRQATVFGQSPRMRYDLMVNTMTRDALAKGVIAVHGAAQLWRPLIAVEAVAALHVAALEGRHGPAIVNAIGGNYTVAEVAKIVADATRARVEVIPMPVDRRVRNYRLSVARQQTMFGPQAGLGSIGTAVKAMIVAMPDDPYDARFENIAAMRKAGVLA